MAESKKPARGLDRKANRRGAARLAAVQALYQMDIAGTGLLPVEAESQGKIVITTEMGGSENVTALVHAETQMGLRNVLMHFGLLPGKAVTRASLGLARPGSGPAVLGFVGVGLPASGTRGHGGMDFVMRWRIAAIS